jgi:alpha-galactosidase
LNLQDEPQNMSFALVESWAIRAGRQYAVYDMWLHQDMGIAVR